MPASFSPLPWPEAQQLAAWIGWRLHGWRGGLAAGLLFVIPGALVMLSLSMLYAVAANFDWGALGMVVAALRPEWLKLKTSSSPAAAGPWPWRDTVLAITIWSAIWAAPMVLVAAILDTDHVLRDIGAFFSQLAVVTVEGA